MGPARVVGSNPLKETVVVELETQVTLELPLEDITVIGPPVPEKLMNNDKKEANDFENQENSTQ